LTPAAEQERPQEIAMTAPSTTVDRARSRREIALVGLTGTAFAVLLGLGAGLIRPEQFWLVVGVFAACSLSPSLALAWLLLGGGRRVQPDPHAEENVESRWLEKAASGALFDVLPAAALGAGAVSLFELDLAADLALLGVVVFALADGMLRYAVLSRREA
jgi:hypothetical protein